MIHVDVRGIEHLAGVTITYPIQPPAVDGSKPPPFTSTFNHFDAVERDGDHYMVRINYEPDLTTINPEPSETGCADQGDFARSYADLVVAAGGPGWPEWVNAPLNELGRPDAFSNVEGGHGFLGGIYPDTVEVPITTPIAR
jgi:hypothetical protein